MIKEEKGTIPLYMTGLLILLLFQILSSDYPRAHDLRSRLRTAVDAAALAGAQTATKVIDEMQTVDAAGNPTSEPEKIVKIIVSKSHAEIQDPAAAKAAADEVFLRNGFSPLDSGELSGSNRNRAPMVITQSVSGQVKTSTKAMNASPPYQNDAYEYTAVVLMRPIFLRGAFFYELAGLREKTVEYNGQIYIPIRLTGTADAVLE